MKFRLLDLFSGIGGFSLGLERSGGFRTVAFCEIDPFCRRVLKKHWPKVPCYEDVTKLTASTLSRDKIGVDAICGGFPCQDISTAGKGAGITQGTRSGLWFEYARLIGELRPGYVIVENVAALLGRGLDRVLGDLAALGYDAEWKVFPASDIGAPHLRDRAWIVAYDAKTSIKNRQQKKSFFENRQWKYRGFRRNSRGPSSWGGQLEPLPRMVRVVNGIPDRVDRIGSCGNAVVPQIPEIIGLAILEAEAKSKKKVKR